MFSCVGLPTRVIVFDMLIVISIGSVSSFFGGNVSFSNELVTSEVLVVTLE